MNGCMPKPLLALLCLGAVLISACTIVSRQPTAVPVHDGQPLKINEQIAGEMMAYLVEVVLGRAGALDNRKAWAERGRDLPLDFDMVSARMFGPLSQRAELMVLDTNILGLSEALYHYDRRLNLFKGERSHDSLFPCVELMAIRLLLLKKIHRGETVSMAGMIRYMDRFLPDSRDAHAAELEAMKLTAGEFSFLKAIFRSEPAFFVYMQHPFIVSTLHRIGVAEADEFTLAADLAATYRQLACPPGRPENRRPVTVAIIAAMNPMFDVHPAFDRITPSADYLQLRAQVEAAIIDQAGLTEASPEAGHRLTFFTPDRPVTIEPQNADRVIDQLCPRADFVVMLMGKNVYRAVHIDPRTDIAPARNRVYLDVGDVRYRQIADDIDSVVSAILPSLTSAAAADQASWTAASPRQP